MSKVVCDICGATYDDAQGGCPVCGWGETGELPSTEDLELDDILGEVDEALEPAPAKAAFDYDAVNKQAAGPAKPAKPAKPAPKKPEPEKDEEEDEDDDEEEESGSNSFLVIILVLLILALLAVSAYIGWTKILKPKMAGDEGNKPQETVSSVYQPTGEVENPTVEQPTGETADVLVPDVAPISAVPCTGLELSGNVDTLFIGQYWRLMAKATPEDTTDPVVYTSSNSAVVSVDEYGRVTAVGNGEAVITITCGTQTIETTVVVKNSETDVATAPDETAAPAPVEGTSGTLPAQNQTQAPVSNSTSGGSFSLGKHDITLIRPGTYFTLPIEGGVSADQIKWRTSDSSIASIYNGVVTCMGRGIAIITAEYNGITEQCVVRCKY